MGDEGENTEAAAAGDENEDMGGDTGAPKRMSYENSKPNTDMTTSIGSSNNNNDVDNIILKRPDENENKMIEKM